MESEGYKSTERLIAEAEISEKVEGIFFECFLTHSVNRRVEHQSIFIYLLHMRSFQTP